jgi:hypothetical protein
MLVIGCLMQAMICIDLKLLCFAVGKVDMLVTLVIFIGMLYIEFLNS